MNPLINLALNVRFLINSIPCLRYFYEYIFYSCFKIAVIEGYIGKTIILLKLKYSKMDG